MPDNQSVFSSEFTAPDEAQWIALVEKTIKGKPFARVMQSKTRDGIIVDALGTRNSSRPSSQPVRAHGNWAIASPNWGRDATTVNRDILIDLERGASAIALTLDSVGPMGVSPDQLSIALEGVYLDMVPLTLIQGEDFLAGVAAYDRLIEERGYSAGALSGSLGVDPIGTLARSGRLQITANQAIEAGASIAARWAAEQPGIATFNADATVLSNAGATECQEVAGAISSAVAYLRAMEQAGLPLDVAAKQIQFTLSASANLWQTIAKFRAVRRLWAGVLAASGVDEVPMKINAVSAVHAVTMKDPWVNILRGTAACFAAALGGADVITTLPHNLFFGASDDFSRRIARNIQIILMEESSLAKVSDPAAGSYSLEKLTGDMAEQSASLFAELEASGGVLAGLRSGTLAAFIADAAASRAKDVRQRKIGITGVSEFPNIHEKPFEKAAGAGADDRSARPPAGETVTSLSMRRLAQEFEDLRFKSDAIVEKTGSRPQIALVNLGTVADFTARTTFAKNFFEAGGIETIGNAGSSTTDEAITLYKASGASIAVICGTDKQYTDMGVELAVALKGAGCARLYLAGKPGNVTDIMAAGLDETIYMGCDVIEAIERAYSALEHMNEGDGL